MNTIICTKCGNIIEINKALEDQVRINIENEYKIIASKELEKVKKETESTITEEVNKRIQSEVKKSQIEIEEIQKYNRQLQTEAIDLTKKIREEKIRQENLELKMQKMLIDEQEKIRKQTIEEISERQRLRDKEKDMLIDSLKKSLDDAQRKANQGSQQVQGEAQELDLEIMLRREFPDDLIEPIGKGVLGADIRQVVKSPRGFDCGRILWESKRTKNWTDNWIVKLKDDLISDKAHIPVIVSEALPFEAGGGIGFKNGVWICSLPYARILSALLRKSLLEAAKQRIISQQKQTKAEDIYNFVTSIEFVHQIETMYEAYRNMLKEIQDEKAVFERVWKKREIQVNRLISGITGIYGSMQGIAGNALPQVKGLDFESMADSDGSDIRLIE